jgi:hypothetical protein
MPLLEDIVRCEEIDAANKDGAHPCRRIVSVQSGIAGGQSYQVPEPWRGDIQSAPLLFVSSNPSINLLDDAPWSHLPTVAIANYYQQPRISSVFPRAQYRYGVPSRRNVPFWSSIHHRAIELYGETTDVRHGRDYAITEIVHCKSTDEFGVDQARHRCLDKFLRRVLAYSHCRFIVTLGGHAEAAMSELQPADLRPRLSLAHPGSFKITNRAKTVRGAIQMGQFTEPDLAHASSGLNEARGALPEFD